MFSFFKFTITPCFVFQLCFKKRVFDSEGRVQETKAKGGSLDGTNPGQLLIQEARHAKNVGNPQDITDAAKEVVDAS